MEYELFNCVPVVRKVQRRRSDVFEVQDEQLPRPERQATRTHSAAGVDASASGDDKTWSVSVPGGPTSTDEREYHEAVARVLRTGGGILAAGGTSREAMEATINLMEESLNLRISEGATRR